MAIVGEAENGTFGGTTMVTTRETVIDLLRSRGEHDQAMAATCVLARRIDTERDAALLHRFGVEERQLAGSR